ncbi:MAG: hypothetical protein DRJ01_02125 [Bacteroidetes bacterium]|nr:MAG: hypothetical protein DRJ01_02125 [Bacteroidota bacterium]
MESKKPTPKSKIGLEPDEFKVWIKDATRGIVPTGGHCLHGCIYCFLQGNKKRLNINSSINFISEDDLRFGLDLLRQREEDGVTEPMYEIDIGSGGQVIQSEPFFHPYYSKLIEIGHEYFPDIGISTVTLGRWSKPEDFDLFRKANWKCHITLNTLDQEKRDYMMKGPDDLKGVKNLLAQDDLLNGLFMVFHGDMEIFKRDIEEINRINPNIIDHKDFRIWPTGYTTHTARNPDVLEMSALGIKNFKEMLSWCRKNKIKINPVFWELEDTMEMIPEGMTFSNHEEEKNDFERRINNTIKLIDDRRIDYDDVGWLLADSVYSFSSRFKDFINRINVKNHTFGGTVTAAGLLTRDDFYYAIKNHPVKYKYYVLSKDVFRIYHEDVMMNKFSSYDTEEFKFIMG